MATYDPKRPKPKVDDDEPAPVEALIDRSDESGTTAPSGEVDLRSDPTADEGPAPQHTSGRGLPDVGDDRVGPARVAVIAAVVVGVVLAFVVFRRRRRS